MTKKTFSRKMRYTAVFLCLNLVYEIIFPTAAWALTGGPSQPEVQSFEPVGTSDMVDLSTGDFNYNIPILDVEGYPVNISYHGGVSMDQEASMIGLGWNLNPGVINRAMRGMPDDFKGDEVKQKYVTKPNWTLGGKAIFTFEALGKSKNLQIPLSLGIKYDNYRGYSASFGATISGEMGRAANMHKPTVGIGLNFDSRGGADADMNYKRTRNSGSESSTYSTTNELKVGAAFNSRNGFKGLSLNYSTTDIVKNGADKIKAGGNSTGGSFLTNVSPSYCPTTKTPVYNWGLTLGLKLGTEALYTHGSLSTSMYYHEQYTSDKEYTKNGYGSLYLDEVPGDNFILDYNRNNNIACTDMTKYLPYSNITYDYYNVNAQGIAGAFRSKQSYVPITYDDEVYTVSTEGGATYEAGLGGLVKTGVDANLTFMTTRDGVKGANNQEDNLLVSQQQRRVYNFEPAYFQNVGEKIPVDEDYYSAIGKETPQDVYNFYKNVGNKMKSKKEVRSQLMQHLTVREVNSSDRVALDRYITNYPLNTIRGISPTSINRSSIQSLHHITELSVVADDGRRYVYGLPAMNNVNEEYTFTTNKPSGAYVGTGLTQYTVTSGEIDFRKSESDVNYSFNSQKIPRYAHSYLLTGLLSPDYIDRTGNGISDDDYGTAVKFNYSHPDNVAYKWRTPFKERSANHQKGNLSDDNDDKGSFVYGEKDMWYMHSIESKNFVAKFYLSKRTDGYGVAGRDGGISTAASMYKLDKICLYAKKELEVLGDNAVPIKTVHFEYNYTLCKKIDNSSVTDSGKLTLTKIYFTYGNSNKGKFTGYNFTYSNVNPDYDIKAYDRWGNYKPTNSQVLYNTEYPYVNQDRQSRADSNVSAWSLTKIDLPSGGSINITYESDDYAYVQNKRAMQMFEIAEISNDIVYDANPTSHLFTGNSNNNYVIFKRTDLTTPISEYFEDVKYLYFNMLTKINKDKWPQENISAFAEIVDGGYGICSDPNYAYIAIKEVDVGNVFGSMHISGIGKEALDFACNNYPQFIYPGSEKKATFQDAVGGLGSAFLEMGAFFENKYRHMRKKEFCNTIDNSRSFVRLNNPVKKKFGGGCRVKEIKLKDNWSAMSSSGSAAQYNGEYGQIYSYTTIEDGREISSGVASYEPMPGGEENPFKQPRYEIHERFLAKDIKEMHLEPYAEALFPSASVVYSKVTVKTLGSDAEKTGYTVTEFYTAKDYPTISYAKDININTNQSKAGKAISTAVNAGIKYLIKMVLKEVGGLSGVSANFDWLYAYQGYTIINNDMHGKMSSQTVYAQDRSNNEFIKSKVVYKYKSEGNKLSNIVKTYNFTSAEVKEKLVGVDFDITLDKQAENSFVANGSAEFNLDMGSFVGLPSFWLDVDIQKNEFKSKVFTKIINQYGILESTEVMEDGSKIKTNNLLYDDETGEVLLTETQNEFDNNIYNMTIPAHASYDGMGMAYQNLNNNYYLMSMSGNRIVPNPYYANLKDSHTLYQSLVGGDELLIDILDISLPNSYGRYDFLKMFKSWNSYLHNHTKLSIRAWVWENRGKKFLIDENGKILDNYDITGNFNFKIIRSGRRNMHNIPVGSFVLLTNPLTYSSGWTLNLEPTNYVLNASASTFSDDWQTFCALEKRAACDSVTLLGSGVKKWLTYLVKHNIVANEMDSLQTRDSIPQEIKDYKFCDNHETKATGYSVVQTSYSTQYVFAGGEVCCPITVSCQTLKCSTALVPKCLLMLDSCQDSVYDNDHVLHSIGTDPFTSYDNYLDSLGYPTNDSLGHCAYLLPNSLCNDYVEYAGQYLYMRTILMESEICDTFTFLDAVDIDSSTFTSVDSNTAKVLVTLSCGTKVWANIMMGECGTFFNRCCKDCEPQADLVLNPYLAGVRGNWRKKADYAYHASRKASKVSGKQKSDLKADGVFETFNPFWSRQGGFSKLQANYGNDGNWIAASTVTAYNPYGNEIENKDALGIYSSALFGYGYKLPVAVAHNAKYTQIAYDGFEDYNYLSDYGGCPAAHWSLESSINVPLDTIRNPHSGLNSLRIDASDSFMVSRKVYNCSNTDLNTDEYMLNACNCIKKFSPDTGKYIIGAWVSEYPDNVAMVNNFKGGHLKVVLKKSCLDTGITYTFYASGPVIEGWQRIEGEFRLLSGYNLVEVYVIADGTNSTNFDDIRIHPFNSNIKTYAFNAVTQKLMAELDENNYATFYEYDNEGQLVRVKKETVKGIVTLKEIRTSLIKK